MIFVSGVMTPTKEERRRRGGGEERHVVGVHTWCPLESKSRAYVLANSLTASGSGKHQYDVDYHFVKNEYDITNVSGLVGDNASTQKGKVNGLLANNARIFGKEMFFVGCYPHVLNIMLRRMCQAGFGAKGDMSNPHVLQLLYKISWLHHERPSQCKVMYVSLGILSKEPPLPQTFIDTRWTYYHETLQWYLKYGKACLQLAECLLERLPKSDCHQTIWQDVIKLSSSLMIQVEIKSLFEFLDKFIIPSLNTSQASDAELGFSSGYLARLWPATVLKHHETLSKMFMSPAEYFPLTSQQVKMSLKDPAAINHFHKQVQRPMLQEAIKVIKDHGAEWLTFPKLFGMGADQRYQSPFWYSVLKLLEIPVRSETIQSLKADGHKLKLQWKASAKGTSALEGQRSFNPTVIEGVTCTPDGQVPRLMQLVALKVWNYGEELPIYDLPRECQLCLQNLPNVFQPPITHLSTSHMSEHVMP